MTHLSPGRLLREAVDGSTIQVPGVPNCLAARLIQQLGFHAGYLSKAGLSAALFALPDRDLVTISDFVDETTRIARRVALPLIVDLVAADSRPLQIELAAIQLEHAGAAALTLAETVRSANAGATPAVDSRGLCAQLRAAANARQDRDLVLIARVDCTGGGGAVDLHDAQRRAEQYVRAGADWIQPASLTSEEQFAWLGQHLDVPLVADMDEFTAAPLLTIQQLAEMNYAAVLYPLTLLRIAMQAMESSLRAIAQDGTQANLLDLMWTREYLLDVVNDAEFEQREAAYFDEDDNEG